MSTLILLALTALAWLAKLTMAPGAGIEDMSLSLAAAALTALLGARLAELALVMLGPRGGGLAGSDRVRTMMRIVVYAAAALLWIHFYRGVDVTGLLATSAVATLVLGLALQTTLGNLFAGLALELERPLRVGDIVVKNGREGEVVALKWRSIFLKTTNNSRIVIPNGALGADSIEVFRKGEPLRLEAFFNVASSVEPARVIAAAQGVLTSGLDNVCVEPAPSTILVGMDATVGHLRYSARFFTLNLPTRNTTLANVHARLWYGLSRIGVAVSPTLAVESVGAPDAPGTTTPPDARDIVEAILTRPPAPRDPETGSGLVATLRRRGERRLYGPGESIALDGGAALLVSGSARIDWPWPPESIAAEVERLRKAADADGPRLLAAPLLSRAGAEAAKFLGPLALTLAERYGRLTDDAFFLWRALASHLAPNSERERFLAEAPALPSRKILPGALFGFDLAILSTRDVDRHARAEDRAEIYYVPPQLLREVLRESDALDMLRAAAPGLAALDSAAFLRWLGP